MTKQAKLDGWDWRVGWDGGRDGLGQDGRVGREGERDSERMALNAALVVAVAGGSQRFLPAGPWNPGVAPKEASAAPVVGGQSASFGGRGLRVLGWFTKKPCCPCGEGRKHRCWERAIRPGARWGDVMRRSEARCGMGAV